MTALLPAPAAPPGPAESSTGLRWALADTWTVALRLLLRWAKRPEEVLVGLLFPVLLLLMFGYLFGGAMTVPGGGDYREFLVPGLFALTMFFGVEATVLGVAADAADGITDRFRSLPMAASAVVGGRAVADMVTSAAGLAVLLGAGVVVGWRPRDGLAAAAAAVGLLLLLRLAVVWAGVWLGLVLRTPQSASIISILVWPFGFLSTALVAAGTMPGWLGTLADWNPLSATATATRDLFGSPVAPGGSWAADNAMLLAVAWPVVLVAVFLPLSALRYRRLSR